MQIHKSRLRNVFWEKHGLNYRRAKGDPCSPEKVISFPEMRYLGEALKHGYEISGSRVINSNKYIRICHFNEWKTQTNISDSDWFPQVTRFNVMTPPELLFSVLAEQPYLFCVSVAQTDWSPLAFLGWKTEGKDRLLIKRDTHSCTLPCVRACDMCSSPTGKCPPPPPESHCVIWTVEKSNRMWILKQKGVKLVFRCNNNKTESSPKFT